MLPVILAAGSAVVAIVAIVRVFSLRSKMTALSQSYWELRYNFARFRARVAKIDGGPSESESIDAAAAGVPRV